MESIGSFFFFVAHILEGDFKFRRSATKDNFDFEIPNHLSHLAYEANNLFQQKFPKKSVTPPKFNIAPAKWWLEDYFPFGKCHFQGRAVSFREGSEQKTT